MAISYKTPDPEVRKAAILALVPRQDNPVVQAALLDHMNRTDDPSLIFDLLGAGVLPGSSAAMTAAIMRHLDSPHQYVRTAALFKLGSVDDPSIIDRIIPHLDSEDYNIREFAMAALADVGKLQPERASAALTAAAQRRPLDKVFVGKVRYRLKELRAPGPNVNEITKWLQNHPDHLLQ